MSPAPVIGFGRNFPLLYRFPEWGASVNRSCASSLYIQLGIQSLVNLPFSSSRILSTLHQLKGVFMNKWECIVCGFIYDEAKGLPRKALRPVPSGKIFRPIGLPGLRRWQRKISRW